MTNPNNANNHLDLKPVERIEVLDPSQYSLQVIVDENGKEKVNLSIHCSPKQMGKGRVRVFKDASGNYGVGFIVSTQAEPKPDHNWRKSLELFNSVLKEID